VKAHRIVVTGEELKMTIEVNLADLKVGDEVPVDAVIRDIYLPVWPVEGPCEFIRLTDIPIAVLVS
jgi:hypothetical protein